jgi:hypothetical protein
MKIKLILIVFFLFLSSICFADELVLVKGKGIPVCEAHFKNLRALGFNEMVCQRDESYPEENGITRPEWEDMDLRENKELVKKNKEVFW